MVHDFGNGFIGTDVQLGDGVVLASSRVVGSDHAVVGNLVSEGGLRGSPVLDDNACLFGIVVVRLSNGDGHLVRTKIITGGRTTPSRAAASAASPRGHGRVTPDHRFASDPGSRRRLRHAETLAHPLQDSRAVEVHTLSEDGFRHEQGPGDLSNESGYGNPKPEQDGGGSKRDRDALEIGLPAGIGRLPDRLKPSRNWQELPVNLNPPARRLEVEERTP